MTIRKSPLTNTDHLDAKLRFYRRKVDKSLPDDNISHMRMSLTKKAGRPRSEAEAWCRSFEDRCRERGIRLTSQRLAVYRALAEDASHPTADAVHARLRHSMPYLSQATVYRILEFLESEALVRRVSTTDGAGRFDANLSRHQHLVCRMCGRMQDFEERTLSKLDLPRQPAPGFVAETLDIRIVGTCEDCRGRPRSGTVKRVKGKTSEARAS